MTSRRSARTNAAGIARLAEVFEPIGPPLGGDRILLAEGSLTRDSMRSARR